MPTRRILLIDDHMMFSDALVFLLRSLDDATEYHAVNTVKDALDALSENRFSLVLVDYAMPEMNGLEALAIISARYPDIPVAIISGIPDTHAMVQALDKGAAGWLSKAMGGEPLFHALNLLLAGQKFVSPELLRTPMPTPLTRREIEVAELVSIGLTDKEIAMRLSMQLGTVKVHVKSLLRKFDTDNRTKFALRYRRA